jgi:hypothetical protein
MAGGRRFGDALDVAGDGLDRVILPSSLVERSAAGVGARRGDAAGGALRTTFCVDPLGDAGNDGGSADDARRGVLCGDAPGGDALWSDAGVRCCDGAAAGARRLTVELGEETRRFGDVAVGAVRGAPAGARRGDAGSAAADAERGRRRGVGDAAARGASVVLAPRDDGFRGAPFGAVFGGITGPCRTAYNTVAARW